MLLLSTSKRVLMRSILALSESCPLASAFRRALMIRSRICSSKTSYRARSASVTICMLAECDSSVKRDRRSRLVRRLPNDFDFSFDALGNVDLPFVVDDDRAHVIDRLDHLKTLL